MAKKGLKFKIQGFDRVAKNLRKEASKIDNASLKGLILATAFIRRDMDKTPPLIPVDTGNLRDSYRTFPSKQKRNVVFGFTANYAAKVHFSSLERNWRRPGSGPLFFSAALTRNRSKILSIIAENAKIRK